MNAQTIQNIKGLVFPILIYLNLAVEPTIILLLLFTIDIMTGAIKAFVCENEVFRSRIGMKGIVEKVVLLIFLVVCSLFFTLIGANQNIIMIVLTMMLACYEFGSIMGNITAIMTGKSSYTDEQDSIILVIDRMSKLVKVMFKKFYRIFDSLIDQIDSKK